MKTVMRIMMLAMIAAILLCAAGCGKGEKETAPAGGTTAPAGTDQTVVEGVEDWEDAPNQQTPTQQTAGEATTEQPTTQPTTGQQTGNEEKPDASKPLTLAEYEAMTTAQQQAYFESFPTVDAFYEWLEEAEKAAQDDNNSVTGDGTLDLNDYINK